MYSEVLPSDKQAKILDIGCGPGHFLYYLKREGYSNFWGIDVSSYIVDFVKKNASERVEQADIFQFLKNSKDEYDIIIGNDLIEHIPKERILDLLTLIHSALKPGGRVILKTPNMGSPFALLARYLDFTHSIGFTEHSLAEVLTVANFQQAAILPGSYRFSMLFRHFTRQTLLHLPGNLAWGIQVSIFEMLVRYLYRLSGRDAPKCLSKNIIGTGIKLENT